MKQEQTLTPSSKCLAINPNEVKTTNLSMSMVVLAACSVLAGCVGDAVEADELEIDSDQAALEELAGQLKSTAGACLGVDPTEGPGGAVKVVSCTPSATSAPDWIFHKDGALVLIENAVTGKCIDALDSGATSGTPLVQADCRFDAAFGDSQLFHTMARIGSYALQPTHARDPWPGQCMTVPGGSTTEGVEAELQACANIRAAQWFVIPR
ncbi:hypothetical protein WMF31_11230 [Sorangium sp. So ce1036]|uniref:RICIN domain-containing protein n=1 Tax=Sorangium sp. So ce1036 TaxID=3133328 RepID=UPI003F0D5FBE